MIFSLSFEFNEVDLKHYLDQHKPQELSILLYLLKSHILNRILNQNQATKHPESVL